ncbi:MAG: hypothetical protein NTY19_42420 [Planctomycetota bacterium]|nr:hypothetical protein [Planctomycetota bacterium]
MSAKKSQTLLCLLSVWLAQPSTLLACSTAVFGPAATADGAPLLWKNRDTDVLSNKVVFVSEKPFSYLGLVNAEEPSGRSVYAGLNVEGFAIFNSVAFNLPAPPTEMKDLEGQIMADALRTCRTVDDFEAYLRKNLGKSLGSQANFGVLDAAGHAALFEVHNHGYQKLDAVAAPGGYLINTNFSRSGPQGKGLGHLRFERASSLVAQAGGKASPRFVLDTLARDFGNALVAAPSLAELAALSGKPPRFLSTEDSLCRAHTSAAVVIQGRQPGPNGLPATMWVAIGEPLCSLAVPLWVEAGTAPALLHDGKDASMYCEAARIRKLLRPFEETDKVKYIDVTRLANQEGTGFLPTLQKAQQAIYEATAAFLQRPHTPAEYAQFQDRMAADALAALQKVR